jgi:hypothetical protein
VNQPCLFNGRIGHVHSSSPDAQRAKNRDDDSAKEDARHPSAAQFEAIRRAVRHLLVYYNKSTKTKPRNAPMTNPQCERVFDDTPVEQRK